MSHRCAHALITTVVAALVLVGVVSVPAQAAPVEPDVAVETAPGIESAEAVEVAALTRPGMSVVEAAVSESSGAGAGVGVGVGVGGGVVVLEPARVLETRGSESTVDGLELGAGLVGPGVIEVDVLGRGGVPASGVSGVLVNVTAVGASVPGFVTVWPCVGEPPTASSLNFWGGVLATPNEVLAKVSSSGSVCVYSSSPVDLVMDVTGYVTESPGVGGGVVVLEPARVLETRGSESTVDGLELGAGLVGPGVIEVDVLGRGGVPASGVSGVLVNVTAVGASVPGFVTVWPCVGEPPTASSLNFWGGVLATPNEVLAKVSSSGSVCVYSSSPVDLVMDVTGYVTESPVGSQPSGLIAEPVHAPGWFVEPAAITFTDDDQTGTFRLVHYGSDGERSGRAVPDGVVLNRPTPTYTMKSLGAGEYRITGAATIGSEVVAFEVPGQHDPIVSSVSSVRYAEGWNIVDESDVIFPPPVGSEVAGIAPFTVEEFEARIHDDISDGSQAHYPVVLAGGPLPVGTKIANNLVLGEVIAPTGAPSITRDGMTLMTLRMTSIPDTFDRVDVGLDFGELNAAGVFETATGVWCPDPVGDDICADPAGFAPVRHGVASPALPNAAAGPKDPCEVAGTVELGELKATIEYSMTNLSVFDWEWNSAEQNGFVTLNPAMEIGGKISLSAKLAPTGKVTMACELEVATPEFEVPGPLAPALTIAIPISLHFDLEGSAQGTLALADWTYTCERTRLVSGGASVLIPELTVIDRSEVGVWRGDCPNPTAPSLNDGFLSGIGPEAKFGIKPWLYPQAKIGVRVGGRVTRIAGEIVGRPELGLIAPLYAKFGPSLQFTYESPGAVMAAKQHASGLTFQIEGEVGLELPFLQSIFDAMFEDWLIGVSFPPLAIAVATSPVQIVGLGASGSPTVTVGGEATTDVSADEAATIAFPALPSGGVLSMSLDDTVYVYESTSDPIAGLVDWTEHFDTAVSGNRTTLTLEMTKELCEEQFSEPRHFEVLGYAGLGGPAVFAAYLGGFDLACGERVWFERPDGAPGPDRQSVEINLTRGTPSATVMLKQAGFDDAGWDVANVGDPGDGLVTVDPVDGTFTTDEVALVFELDCGDDVETEDVTWYQPNVGGELRDARVDVSYRCGDWIDIVPGAVTAPSTVQVESDGDESDTWQITSGGNVASPHDGVLLDEHETFSLAISDPRPAPACEEELPQGDAWVTISTGDRGSDSVYVTLPAREGDSCSPSSSPGWPGTSWPGGPAGPGCISGCGGPGYDNDDGGGGGSGSGGGGRAYIVGGSEGDASPEAGAEGDPHIVSFDGLRYEAQVLGEYVYAESAGDEFRMVVRHDRATAGAGSAFGATIAAAASIEYEGAQVEFYLEPDGVAVYVNGEATVPVGNLLTFAGPGLSVARASSSSDDYVVRIPGGGRVEISDRSDSSVPYMDVMMSVPPDGSLQGLLGSNDGIAFNDVARADGYILTDEAVAEHGAQFYTFTDSWRLGDQADSPFTVASAIFDEPNDPRPSDEDLAPFRAQAETLLGGLSAICASGDTPNDGLIGRVAIELAVGTDPSDIGDLSCDYVVVGQVTTRGGELGVDQAFVEIDAPGLAPCSTITDPTGWFRCSTAPDVDEVGDGSGITFPLEFDYAVTAPGGVAPAVTITGDFDSPPGYGEQAVSSDNPVDLPTGSLTIIDLAGTLTQFGAPVTEWTGFDLAVLDAGDGVLTERGRFIEPDEHGSYSAAFVLPFGADELSVTWRRGPKPEDYPAQSFGGFGPGANAVTFSPDFVTAVQVTIDATLTVDGAPFTEPTYLSYRGRAANGDVLAATTEVAIDPDDTGFATTTFELGAGVRLVDVAWIVTAGPITQTFDVEMGVNDLVYAQDTQPVDLTISGTLTENGAAFGDPTDLLVRGFDVRGSQVGSVHAVTVDPDDGTGAYTGSVELPANVAEVEVEVGWSEAVPFAADEYDVAPGANDITFHGTITELGPQGVAVSGTLTVGGDPWPSDVRFQLRYTRPNGSTFNRYVDVVADQTTGEYSFEHEPGTATTKIEIFSALEGSGSKVVDPLPDAGTTDVEFDVAIGGTVVLVSGTASAGAESLSSVGLVVTGTDPGDPNWYDNAYGSSSVGGDGSYGALLYTSHEPTEVLLGAYGVFEYSDDYLFSAPIPVAPGVNELSDFDLDLEPHLIEFSGTLTNNGAPVTAPIDLAIEYVVDAPWIRPSWSDEVTVTPDGNGDYSVTLTAPLSADRAVIAADLPVAEGERTVEIGPLAAGTTLGGITLAYGTHPVAVGGTVLDGASPLTREFDLYVTSYDGADEMLVSQRVATEPDGTGVYARTVDVPIAATRVEVRADLTDYGGMDFPVADPALQFSTEAVLEDPPPTELTFDITITVLEISGVVTTSADEPAPRADAYFDVEVVAYDTGDAELASFTAEFATDEFGAYAEELALPAGTVRVELVPDLSGVAPISIGGLGEGFNQRVDVDLVGDPFRMVTIGGRFALDGANPTSGYSYHLAGFRNVDTGDAIDRDLVWDAEPVINFTGNDGSFTMTVQVPPEVELLTFSSFFVVQGVFTDYNRAFDLRGTPTELALDVEIDHRDDRVIVAGVASLAEACAPDEEEPFLFRATVRAYAGDPDGPTPPAPVMIVDTLVVPESYMTDVGGVDANFELAAAVPLGTTHVDVVFTTTGVDEPGGATYEETLDPVEYAGGEALLITDLTAACP